MTVKEIIYLAATELGIKTEVESHIEKNATNGAKNAQLLLHCYNTVERELGLDYFPLNATESLYTSTGKIMFFSFSKAVTQIVKIQKENGEEQACEMFAGYLLTDPGTLHIFYRYAPEEKGFSDSSDVNVVVSKNMLTYGVVAAFALASGRYQEWEIWDQKYKESIKAAYQMQSANRMQSRRWV